MPSASRMATPAPSVSGNAFETAKPESVLARYPEVARPLIEPCDDPRAVLAVRKQFDRSGRVLVQQAILAHPELTVVAERAQRPGEIDVYETIYGTKNFARLYPGQPLFSEAVVARCADVATCNRVAAMFQAISPRDKVQLSCGIPPATTGGFARVPELSASSLKLPEANTASVATACARIQVCLAQLRQSAPARCEQQRLDAAPRECSAASSCSDVVACALARLR
jgi:hypothetical protein